MTKAAELAKWGEVTTNGQVSGRRNLIINGTGIINQRGSNTTINTYGPDRWRSYGGPGSFTFSSGATAGAGEGDTYAIKFQRPVGNTVTNAMGITQGLESVDSKHLAGKTVTFSFRVRRGADWNVDINFNVYAGTGTDENPVGMTNLASQFAGSVTAGNLTTSWQTITATGTIAADRTQVSVAIAWTPTGTAGANEYIEFREFQLEEGSQATNFEHRSVGEELALCQRYYHEQGNYPPSPNSGYEGFFVGASFAATGVRGVMHLPTTMRTTPTFSTSGDFVLLGGSADAVSSIALADGGGNPAVALHVNTGSTTAGEAFELRSNNDQDARVQFDAEL